MHQHMSHTNYILPLHFGMLCLQVFRKVVGSLSDNLNVLHHSIEEYLITTKVIQSLALKKTLDIANSR